MTDLKLFAPNFYSILQTHEAAVANYVGGQDRGQTAFHFRALPGRETIELPCENLYGERRPE